jgi:hypothetical protein
MSRRHHSPPIATPARSWRIASGIVVPLILGSAAHVAAGGTWSAPPIVAVAVLLFGPVWVLSRRELGLLGIATLLVSGQLITHAALMFGSAHMADTAMPGAPSLAFHLLAAAGAGWWMRRGERRVWEHARRVVNAVGRCVCHLLHGAPPVDAAAAVVLIPTSGVGTRRGRLVLRHVIVLRAPPTLA